MSRAKKNNTPENLEKMRNILALFENTLHTNLKEMEITQTRLQGADREIVKRRFIFDIQLLHNKCVEAKGKVEWAKRLVQSIENTIAQKKQQEDDAKAEAKAIKECCMSENVTHFPFKSLKTFFA